MTSQPRPARCIWLTGDDGLVLVEMLRYGNPAIAKWAESMLARGDAAPADSTEAVSKALAAYFNTITHARVGPSTDAALGALGYPRTEQA